MNDHQLIEKLLAIVIKAGREIINVYQQEFISRTKADGTFVTIADERAEKIISGDITKIGQSLGSEFFLVDPLDGTRDFINRTDEFTVNIALIRNQFPVLGVIYAPVLNELYYAVCGKAFKQAPANTEAVSIAVKNIDPATTKAAVTAITSRLNSNAKTKSVLAEMTIKEFVTAGSSLKFCRIAEGKADIYPRLGRTMEWDTAAGQAILEAAGGCVLIHPSRERLYYKKENRGFDNPEFMAFGYNPFKNK